MNRKVKRYIKAVRRRRAAQVDELNAWCALSFEEQREADRALYTPDSNEEVTAVLTAPAAQAAAR